MNSARRILPLVILVVPAFAVGCGGGGPQAVSATELVQKGDEICSQSRERFLQTSTVPLHNASGGADQAEKLIEVLEDELSDLRNLEPPDPPRAAYDRYLASLDRYRDYLQRGKDAAEQQDGKAFAAAQAAAAAGAAKRQQLARAVGFKECSKAPGTD